MANLDTIRFQKITLKKFNRDDIGSLINELKKRKIKHRLTQDSIFFDERFLKEVRDLVPPSMR